MEHAEIRDLAQRQAPRRAMDARFYFDPDIFQLEIERIFLRSWIYAGHVSEVPQPGDWLLFEFADESVIIIRGGDGVIRALVNVCRHRGSRLQAEQSGCARRLTCPYHGWTYGLDGRLLTAAHMGAQFDKSEYGLRSIRCEVLHGLVFVNFAHDPAPFGIFREELDDCLAPYGLADAKLAHRQSYPIEANWKLSVENYTECYHCASSHPGYSKGHSLARPWAQSGQLMEAANEKRPACGLPVKSLRKFGLEAPAFGADVSYEPYPMWNGHLTGSRDGQPLAPLLGSISGYDGACTDMHLGPVTFSLNYCDHVVIFRFTPVSAERSVCDISWLVRGDAVEGKDYDRADLTWLWDVTTREDKRIIEANAKGIASRMFIPGPCSEMEDYLWRFVAWYLDTMANCEPAEEEKRFERQA